MLKQEAIERATALLAKEQLQHLGVCHTHFVRHDDLARYVPTGYDAWWIFCALSRFKSRRWVLLTFWWK